MKLIKWSNAYVTNIRVIDEDHKNLFEMFKLLHNAYVTNKEPAHIRNVVERLRVYVDHHFKREEQLMGSSSYPLFDKHKVIHRRYVDEVEALLVLIDTEPENINLGKIVHYLSAWLDNHIKKVDMHFATYLRSGKDAKKANGKEPVRTEMTELVAEVPEDKAEVIKQFIELALAGEVPENLQQQIDAYKAKKLARARKLFMK